MASYNYESDDWDKDTRYMGYSSQYPPQQQPSKEQHVTRPKDPTLIKILLVVANVAFLVFGAVSMGLGFWTLIAMRSQLTLSITVIYGHRLHGQLLISAGAIVVFTSGMLMITAGVGFILINKVKERPYKPYLFLMTASLILYFAAAALSTAFIGQTHQIFVTNSLEKKNEITNFMTNTLKDKYGVNLEDNEYRTLTEAWDQVQDEMFCCAVEHNSWRAYYQTQWWNSQGGVEFADRPYVPKSCCVRDQFEQYRDQQMCQTWMLGPPGQPTGNIPNPAVYYRGCWNSCNEFMKETHYVQASSLMAFGIIVSIVIGITIGLTVWLRSSTTPKVATQGRR